MNKFKINRIARKIVVAEGNNVFDDYFDFYNDGQWTIQVCRKLIDTLGILYSKMSAYNTHIQVIQEYVGYLFMVNLDDMNTKESEKKINKDVNEIKKLYENYESDKEKRQENEEKYKKSVNELREYVISYESTCVSIFKRRYVEDEPNVSNLLKTIREKGNYVIGNN